MKRTSGNKPSQNGGEGIPGRERSVYRRLKAGNDRSRPGMQADKVAWRLE